MDEEHSTRSLPDVAGLVEEPRPMLTSLTVHRGDTPGDSEVDVEVTLSWGKDWSSGRHAGPVTENGLIEASARATLDALHGLLPPTLEFELRWAGLVMADDPDAHEIVNVLVAVGSGAGSEIYIGAALARNDARVAAVRATLDGINRRLMFLIAH